MPTNWLRQTPEQPLFPEILWSRPESRQGRGKLLIIGGNVQSFAAVSQAYAAATRAGAGVTRILVPDALHKTLGKVFPEAAFAPSTPSGSFARVSLATFMDLAGQSDAVLLAGDFGRNSETAIVIESFIQKYEGALTLAGDSLDYFLKSGRSLTGRANTLLAADLGQLQKLAIPNFVIRHSIDLQAMVNTLGEWSLESDCSFMTTHAGQSIIASAGRVSTTPATSNLLELAARASVFWLQNENKKFEAITASMIM